MGSDRHNLGWCGLRVEVFLGLLDRLAQIVIGSDVVSFKNRTGTVTRNRHRHAFADAGADHVPHSGSPQVVKEFSRKSRSPARGRPRLPKVADRQAVTMKNIWTDSNAAIGSLVLASRPPALDDGPQLALQNNFVRPVVLHVFRARHNHAGVAVHVAPFQLPELTFAPCTEIGKAAEVLEIFRKMRSDSLKFRILEESLPDVIFSQAPDVRRHDNETSLDAELERLAQQARLPVDGRRRTWTDSGFRVAGKSIVNVIVHDLRSHIDGAQVTERLSR